MMLTATDLSVHFRASLFRRKVKALDGLNLVIQEGEFFALLGQNGAGKSTAMYCFLGLLRPSSGSVRVLGEVPRPGSPVFASIAYLPEDPHYHPYLSIDEALQYYAALYRTRLTAQERIALLDRFELGEARNQKLGTCSKGMKQKFGIAQCLLCRPRLMFLDEPMRGLDPLAVHTFRDILRDLHRSGTTIVMNSHIMAEIEMVATRAAVIDHGKLVVEDRIENLTRLGGGEYEVALEGTGSLPGCLKITHRSGTMVQGTVQEPDLYDLLDHARSNRLKLVKCSLKKATLEESFLAILEAQRASA
jgi:ABC-type multidrug transport system ATPase subunit